MENDKSQVKLYGKINAQPEAGKSSEVAAENKPVQKRRPAPRKYAQEKAVKSSDAHPAPTEKKSETRTAQKPGAKQQNPAGVKSTHKPAAQKAADKPAQRPHTRRNTPNQSAQAPKMVSGIQKSTSLTRLRIIPLGGLGEIGKNMTVYECGEDCFIVDCGLSFPDDEMLGVDIVIPDFSYLFEIKDRLRGLIITHGHEDHIGAIPYLLKQLNIPIYGTKLTIGLIEAKLLEHKLPHKPSLMVIKAGQTVNFGCMSAEAIRVNHSIPDAVALAIKTPVGLVVQTGDFKVDYTPVFDETIDLTRFGQLGSEGVLALLSDSTNAERPGNSETESKVGESLEKLFSRAEGKRLLIATFASNIQRVQQIIDLAQRHGRKIALSGRSMENYTRIALELGYLKMTDDILVGIDEIKKYRASDLIIITTGSQGEPLSALSRMASGQHKQVQIGSEDMIIISATPIPGNEKMVTRVINGLMKLGSEVIYEKMYETHASGHACQDELKLMLRLTKPKFFIPVHGEYKHLVKHAGIARSVGVPNENILLPDIGNVMEFTKSTGRINGMVPAGRVFVDGLGVGDVGSVVLRDRKHLAQDGLIVVVCSVDVDANDIISGPDIISRGFVYVKESEPLMEEAKALARKVLEQSFEKGKYGKGDQRMRLREELGQLMYQRTKRNPMILPVIMEL
ncbi:MAG: RNase J family beta-CASP ribonuclease [Oscillospiraceae bacterium]